MKHYFDVDVASDVGVHAAVVFENIAYWIEHNRKAGKNEREGRFWMFSTQSDLAGQFEYLSLKQTRTAIEKLIDAEYIMPGCFNRHGYDRTRWYTLAEKGNSVVRKRKIDVPAEANGQTKRAEGIVGNVKTIQDIKKDFEKEKYKQKVRDIAERCGAVCNI